MTDPRKEFLSKVLDAIEERESRLLVWGIVDGAFQTQELAELILPLIDSALTDGFTDFFDPNEVIHELLELKWLVEAELLDHSVGYRSRMAETVRLSASASAYARVMKSAMLTSPTETDFTD